MLTKILSVIGAYKLYEKWLWDQVKNGEKVEHIAIVLDGNRRWANEKEMNPWLGHKKGAIPWRNCWTGAKNLVSNS
jgi:tritrans,polycis-undecaprenyl-diphosphate synthase [geranylgeranyl-diphosphate specific]